jgi:hypothetical protein
MSWNRLISVLVAVIYLAIAFAHGGMEPTFKIGMFLILPLACIWFADAMGGYTGLTTSMPITAPSPGVIVCILGWVLLLLPLIIGIIVYAEA